MCVVLRMGWCLLLSANFACYIWKGWTMLFFMQGSLRCFVHSLESVFVQFGTFLMFGKFFVFVCISCV